MEEVTSSSTCSPSNPCYVVAGSNNIEPVKTKNDVIDPSNALVPQWIGGGTGIDTSTSLLQNIADNPDYGTDNPDFQEVFQTFPKGTNSGEGLTDDSESGLRRNPLEVCRIDLGKCQ